MIAKSKFTVTSVFDAPDNTIANHVNMTSDTCRVDRLRGAGIAIAICFLTAPIAVILTIVLLPLWSFIESTFGMESVGHSGPAEWCYLAVYLVILGIATIIWEVIRRRTAR